jgi:hypothetical protein
MRRGDQLVERAAGRVEGLARRAAADGGLKEKLARPLAEDAELLRAMRPSLIAARLRGRPAGEGAATAAATAPLPTAEPRPRPAKRSGGGPSPAVVVAAAFVLGVVIARLVDWRGHAHPRL